nr:immunoglobulin light chain junction region [Macaca mulatta]
RQQDFDWPPTF